MDSPPECFDGLRLAIQSHSVHKVENADTEDREYVVSNLRVFQIEVVLVNERNELAQTTNVALHASLLTENGLDLVWPNPQEPMLTGETEAVIIGGRGLFKLKMGASVLSSKMGKQRFRVKIEPKSERLQRDFPQLTVLTESLPRISPISPISPRLPGAHRAAQVGHQARPQATPAARQHGRRLAQLLAPLLARQLAWLRGPLLARLLARLLRVLARVRARQLARQLARRLALQAARRRQLARRLALQAARRLAQRQVRLLRALARLLARQLAWLLARLLALQARRRRRRQKQAQC